MVSPWRSDITGPLHFVSFASEVNAMVVSLLYTLLLSVGGFPLYPAAVHHIHPPV